MGAAGSATVQPLAGGHRARRDGPRGRQPVTARPGGLGRTELDPEFDQVSIKFDQAGRSARMWVAPARGAVHGQASAARAEAFGDAGESVAGGVGPADAVVDDVISRRPPATTPCT